MSVIDPELSVVIDGRYPMSFMENRFSIDGETRICDGDFLASFLESPDTFSSHISISMLDMYASMQRNNIIQEPTDDKQPNVICNSGTQYEDVVKMHSHNFEWSMRNHEMGGPSNPPTSLQNNLSGGHLTHSNPSEPLDSNNDEANSRIDESASDRPLDDESTDRDQSSMVMLMAIASN
ncbi:hypothetical protein HAX54_023841 [Datura stramonium]|uniref:Uncharacterized protein n=1 Tax=Datura stramonium TaxID=4076 RepID=A0ABS8UZF8_DATST|nr:hypothetical protein [Datura stramonium]